jgi:hypothetical protein
MIVAAETVGSFEKKSRPSRCLSDAGAGCPDREPKFRFQAASRSLIVAEAVPGGSDGANDK